MRKTKQYYTFPNHFWIKAQRMGRPSPWMDRSVYLGSKDNLPPGANAEKLKPLNNSISIELREKQQEIFDQCKDWSSCLVEAHTGFGKAQPKDTPVLCENGWIAIGNLSVGDNIYGVNGELQKVTGIFDQGVIPTYKITFNDKSSTTCCGNHLWNVRTGTQKKEGKGFITIKTSEIDVTKDYQIPVVSPIQFPKKDYKIPPYILGALLGDGSFRNQRISLSSNNNLIINEFKNYSKSTGLTMNTREKSSKAMDHFIVTERGEQNLLMEEIKRLGLMEKYSHEKFIPKEYLYGSIEDRKSLLAGLMDTDGSAEKSHITFSTSSSGLHKDFCELVRSLGGITKTYIKKLPKYSYEGEVRLGKENYSVSVNLDFNPFGVNAEKSKKAQRLLESKKYFPTRVIRSIERVDDADSRCIKVSNDDELYITNDYIVTHNTVISLSLCEYWGDKTLIICHTKDMVNQFYESFEKFYGKEFTKGKVGRYFSNKKQLCTVTITTTRSFANNTEKFKEYGFDNIIRDEADLEFSETQRNALTDFGAKRLIGMTGTIFKEEFDSYLDKVEGDEPALVRFYGGHVKSEESCSDVLAGIYTLEYDKQYTDQWGIPYSPQKEWIKFREQLDGDKDRKILMMRWIHKNVEKGEHVLVLFDRVADTELFYKAFREHRPDLNSFLVHGSVNKKQREHNIASFKDGGGVMFGQYKTVGRGFDNVKLSKLFILFPVKGENNVVQMFGRVLRKFLDKQSYVYDFVDRSLIFQYRQRKKIYKEKYGVTPVMVNAS